MADETQAIFIIMLVVLIVLVLQFTIADVKDSREIQDMFSKVSREAAYFYRVLSSSCLSNQYNENNDIKMDKFIVDKNQLNAIQFNSEGIPVVPCLEIPSAKYQIHIKDLETNENWTFQNYQTTDRKQCRRIIPDYDAIIQINDNSVPPVHALALPELDIYRIGIISVGIEYFDSDSIPNDVICEKQSDPPDIFIEGGNLNTHVDDTYAYNDNNCESGNCIKGPGQANATCQESSYSYDIAKNSACTYDGDCATNNCIAGICTDIDPADQDPPDKLVNCQPCTKDEDCLRGHCNYLYYCSTPP